MALTKVQKKKYFSRHGNRCPYCSSEDLRALGQPYIIGHRRMNKRSANGECIRQDVQCFSCGKIWTDIYTLSDIEK